MAWSDCDSSCGGSIKIPVGEKGDNGASASNIVTVSSNGTTTLTSAQTGSTVILGSATGGTVVLPTDPPVGTTFDFIVTTDVTSNNYSIDTGSGDVFNGSVYGMKASTAPELFNANAALSDTHIDMNGSTTGGLRGTSLSMFYSDATNNTWTVTGQFYGTGTLATIFS